ncbi:MAG: YihY/virulence factor BrkB family protein [Oceanicaulis sp.]
MLSAVTSNRYVAATRRAAGDAAQENLSFIAGGVAFFGFLAVFPALGAAIMVWGLVADPSMIEERLARFGEMAPPAAWEVISGQLERIAAGSSASLGLGALVALVLAFWSAAKGARALIAAMNIAYAEDDERNFIKSNLVALAFTIGGILYAVATLILVGALPAILSAISLGAFAEAAIEAARWLVAVILFALALSALYRFAPDREAKPGFKLLAPGAVAATLLWIAASVGFSVYTANFADYNATFGALGSVAVLMLWMWISAFIVCFGAVLNAELEPGGRS